MRGSMLGTVFISAGIIATSSPRDAHAVGWAQIKAVYGGRCLDVQGGNSDNFTPVQMYDCNGTPAQQWVISLGQHPNPIWSGVPTNELLFKVLEASSADNFANVSLDEWGAGSNQQWSMPRIEILSNVLGNKCVTADGSGTAQMSDCTWAADQFFTYDESTSTVRTLDGRCLGINDGISHDELPYAYALSCNGSVNQKWSLQNGNFVLNWDGQEQRCLDLQNNTYLPLYPCNGNPAQTFYARGQIADQPSGRCLQLPRRGSDLPYWAGVLPELFDCSGDIAQEWEIRW